MQYSVWLENIPETDKLVFKLIFSLSEKARGRNCSYKVIDDGALSSHDIEICGYPHNLSGSARSDRAIVIYDLNGSVSNSHPYVITRPLIATRVLGVLDNYVSQVCAKRLTVEVRAEQAQDQLQRAQEDDPEAEVDFYITEEEACELAIVDDEALSNPSNLSLKKDESNTNQTPMTLSGARPPLRSASLLRLHPEKEIEEIRLESEFTDEDSNGYQPRALVVDDSPSVRKQIELELELFNVEVDYAQNMNEATDLATTIQYDIAFLDVVLPDGDGFQICKNIKSKRKEVTVIMLTGKASPADKIKGAMAGCDAYLVKPVGRMTFQNTVCKYLRLREQFEAVHG